MAKEGSTVSGLVSSFAQALSIALQHGVSLDLFCEKFAYTRFEPSGWTGNPEVPNASSVMDYIFRWLHLRFIRKAPSDEPAMCRDTRALPPEGSAHIASRVCLDASDAPSCRHCGSLTRRNGSCYVCANCGASTGCS
jgi:ribonucleoside-diphosphate reductase alpha chain